MAKTGVACEKSQKIRFESRGQAAAFALRRAAKYGGYRIYKCSHCRGYHLTTRM